MKRALDRLSAYFKRRAYRCGYEDAIGHAKLAIQQAKQRTIPGRPDP